MLRIMFVMFCCLPLSMRAADDSEYYTALGRITRACLHLQHGQPFGESPPAPYGTGEGEIFEELRETGVWHRFTWDQKREFVLVSLFDCYLDGHSAEAFVGMVEADAMKMYVDLNSVPKSYLRDFRHLNRKGIEHFRSSVKRLLFQDSTLP